VRSDSPGDKHLRSGDFFDVERHPQIVFTARSVAAGSAGVTVTGELAIGPARVPLEVPVTVERLADDVARLAGDTSIPREAAGLTWNWLGTLGRDATLHARLTLKR
jgi:polyisoprenoid-binding protein YceI